MTPDYETCPQPMHWLCRVPLAARLVAPGSGIVLAAPPLADGKG